MVEMNIKFSGGHSCSQHANCTLPQNICGIVLCDKTAHFRVAVYSHQHKVHLCNDHGVQLLDMPLPVRWMDYLGKGEMITNRDVNKCVQNI